jgi:F-type H+-transporting ATPase subunit alpha
VTTIYAGTHGQLDKVPVNRVVEWKEGFARFMRSEHKQLLSDIEEKKALDEGLEKQIGEAIDAFNRQFGVEADQKAQPKAEQPREEKPEDKAEDKPEGKPESNGEEKAEE